MIKNTVFAMLVIMSLFVLFTEAGFDLAISVVGRGINMLIAYADTIH